MGDGVGEEHFTGGVPTTVQEREVGVRHPQGSKAEGCCVGVRPGELVAEIPE